MKETLFLNTELLALIEQDIDSAQKKNNPDEAIRLLKLAKEQNAEFVTTGVKQMAEHIDIDSQMPVIELIHRMQEVDASFAKQDSPDLNDLLLTISAFLNTLGCENIAHALYSKNVIAACNRLFDEAINRQQTLLQLESQKVRVGKRGMEARYNKEDELIIIVIHDWLKQNQPDIFKFSLDNHQRYFDLSRASGGFIRSEETMYKGITEWLSKFNRLITGEPAHKPRKIIKVLAEKYVATAQ